MTLLDEVMDWVERHAAHAGRAPLAELRRILDSYTHDSSSGDTDA